MPVILRTVRVPRWAGLALLGLATPVVAQQAASAPRAAPSAHPDFADRAASGDTRRLATWVAASGDNRGLPFVIVDKIEATVFVFDAQAELRGAAPALLGLARRDDEVAGIGTRKLATIRPAERSTPAGRFEAALGSDLTQDLLWIDYDAALSMHRVVVGNPTDRRHARLASPTPLDNRISYGCINVPAPFYDGVIAPAFKGTVGIVYILPETRPIETVFAMKPSSTSLSIRP